MVRGSVLKDEPRFEGFKVRFSEVSVSLRMGIFRFDQRLINVE